MDFDFAQISTPFRMRPGLSRLASDARHLTPLRPGSPLHTEKLAIQRTATTRHAVPGFDPKTALATIRTHALRAGISSRDIDTQALELLVEEDLVVLDTHTGTVPWMCVSVPSRWAPEEKLGRTLSEVHQPVADAAALAAAMPQVLRVLANGTHWERHVWTVTPSSRFDQHPVRQPLQAWPDTTSPDELAGQCYFRAERQTFIPVTDDTETPGRLAVFTIRVMIEPLAQALQSDADAQRLHDGLASMSAAVLAYKDLTQAQPLLLRWLTQRASIGA